MEDVMVDHPSHYQSETGLEAIDVIEAFTFDLKGVEVMSGTALQNLLARKRRVEKISDPILLASSTVSHLPL